MKESLKMTAGVILFVIGLGFVVAFLVELVARGGRLL